MRIEELRIGNYVSYSSNYLKVNSLGDLGISLDFKKKYTIGFLDIDDVKPIALTEEWLVKFGFEKGSDIMGDCYFIEDPIYDIDFPIHIDEEGNFEFYGLHIKIKYVHQLQNVFNIIAEQELSFNKNENTTDIPKS